MMEVISTEGWGRLDYVRFYSEAWKAPVIPVTNKKHPMVKWHPYQKRMPTPDELRLWFEEWHPWGLAIVCGAVSGNLFSLDIDTPELFATLKQAGAFPPGACIHTTAKGYHVIMRSDTVPYTVKEHNPDLTPEFWDFGIGGDPCLAIVPDTPDRNWMRLYEEPAEVQYDTWLKKYVQWAPKPHDMSHDGWLKDAMTCPFHKGGQEETPSLYINILDKGFNCFGCGQKGSLLHLLTECKKLGHPLPQHVFDAIAADVPLLRPVTVDLDEVLPEPLIEDLLEAGENAKAIFHGVSGIGKTTLLLSIAIPASQEDGKVLGRLRVSKALRVGYINFEQSGTAIERTRTRMEPYLGKAGYLVVLPGKGKKVMSDEDRNEIRIAIAAHQLDLLCLDSIKNFVNDPNDEEQTRLVEDFLTEVVEELECAVLLAHHTAKGEQRGTEGAGGKLGVRLVRWAGTKLWYHSLEPKQDYVGRLEGETREWGTVDWAIEYDEVTHAAWIVDWNKVGISKEDLRVLGTKHPAIRILETGLRYCRRIGKSYAEVAEEIGVSDRTLYYWLNGDKWPSDETAERIISWFSSITPEATGMPSVLERGMSRPEAVHEAPDSIAAETSPKATTQSLRERDEEIDVSGISSQVTLSILKDESIPRGQEAGPALCDKCPLKGRPMVGDWGEGKILLVGEAPGEVEAKRGEPFVGPAGDYLHFLLGLASIEIDDCTITNTCICHPPNNKLPGTKPIKCCLPRLRATLERVNPETVILLGEKAVGALLPQCSLKRFHGKRVMGGDGRIYIPMYHPAAGLHEPYYMPILSEDFEGLPTAKIIKEIVGEYKIERLRGGAGGGKKYEPKGAAPVLDIETNTKTGKMIGGSLCFEPGKATYYEGVELIKALTQHTPRRLIGHNLKFDLHCLSGATWPSMDFSWEDCELDDTDLLAYCMNYRDLSLKVLETQELELWHPTYSEICPKDKTLVDLPIERVGYYCCQDSDSTRRLWDYLWSQATEDERNLYETVEKPLLPILTRMEEEGICIDTDYVVEWQAKLDEEAAEYGYKLGALGLTDNVLSSPKKLGQWLKDKGIDLPTTGRSGQVSTDREDLTRVWGQHEAIPLILEYRHVEKLKSVYLAALINLTENGILRTQFNQTRVVTGRLSSSVPNLQNLPHTFDARRPFIARPGNVLLGIDYSQIDMRILAYITGDPELIAAFERKEDIHSWISDELFGNHKDLYRRIIKSTGYAAIYGGGAKGLQKHMEMRLLVEGKEATPPTLKECEDILDLYYTRFSAIKDWQDGTKRFAKENGYVEDWFKRRRYLPGAASRDRRHQAKAFRGAINFPIAATASEIFKLSIVAAAPIWLPILNIHDELVFDIPKDRVDELQPQLEEAMRGVASPCPLVVNSKVGASLGDFV